MNLFSKKHGNKAFLLILLMSFLLWKVHFVSAYNEIITHAQESWIRETRGSRNPYINFHEEMIRRGSNLNAQFTKNFTEFQPNSPLALATGDLNKDGIDDLVSTYSQAGGGKIILHFGNIDYRYPNSPEARHRKSLSGVAPLPFLETEKELLLPIEPAYVAIGDFDGDGNIDIASAETGGNAIYLFAGSGKGEFDPIKTYPLQGNITAFTTGEVNRQDGLVDIVVGVNQLDSNELLVFESPEGSLNHAPEKFQIPTAIRSIAIGNVDDDFLTDVVVAAGNQVVVIHGRDRRLSQDKASQMSVPSAQIEQRSFNTEPVSVAVGDFDGSHRATIAMLNAAGDVELMSATPETTHTNSAKSPLLAMQETLITTLPQTIMTGSATRPPRLLQARVSSLDMDHLIVTDEVNQQIYVVTNTQSTYAKQATSEVGSSLSSRYSIDVSDRPVATVPMRLNEDALSDLVILKSGATPLTLAVSESQNTFVVTSSNLSGAGTLEQAIRDANANPGLDKIVFNLPNSTLWCAAATAVTDAVVIDGTTQPGYAGTPIVEVDPGAAFLLANLQVSSANSVVRGIITIANHDSSQGSYSGSGILLKNGGNNIVENCYLGVDIRGTCTLVSVRGNLTCQTGNIWGISLDNSSNNKIGGTVASAKNIISGNTNFGVQVGVGSNSNQITGNYIGPDSSGLKRIASNGGIYIRGNDNVIGGTISGAGNLVSCANGQGISLYQATGNRIQGNLIGVNPSGRASNGLNEFGNRNEIHLTDASGNTIGGTVSLARNILAADGQGGIGLSSNSSDNLIQGNHIGIDASGTVAIGRGADLSLDGHGNLVGGLVAGARNLIFGGVGVGGNTNKVQGNYIGTTISGLSKPLYTPSIYTANNWYGVGVGGQDNLIGGTIPEARNVIAGNPLGGVVVGGLGNLIYGNFIGTGADGVTPLGNGQEGIGCFDYSTARTPGRENKIGGVGQGEGNIIAFNDGEGVFIEASINNLFVRGNSIYSNGRLGIDIYSRGPNSIFQNQGELRLNNAPVIKLVTVVQGRVLIKGMVNSLPNITTTLDFYASPSCDFSGSGQGKTYLGSTTITTGASPDIDFTTTIMADIQPSQVVTATATRPGELTSEFSTCIGLTQGCISTYNFIRTNEEEQNLIEDKQFIPLIGGTGTFGIGSMNNCPWNATTSDNWITIISGSGISDGIVTYSVQPNPTVKPRVGKITVGGVSKIISQAGTVAIVSGASYQPSFGWNAILSGFGDGLAINTILAETQPLPKILGGTRVIFADRFRRSPALPLFFVSPSQINFHLPTTPNISPTTAYVINGEGGVSTGKLEIAYGIVPALFSANADGAGIAAAIVQRVRQDGISVYENVATFDQTQRRFVPKPIDLGTETDNVYLLLFGNCIPPGNAGDIKLGDVILKVSYAGSQGYFVGLDQINVLLPKSLAGSGLVSVTFKYDDYFSNTVQVNIK